MNRKVLNAGCGPKLPDRLHPTFRDGSWQEIRMDIDPHMDPDLIGSLADLNQIPDRTFDAVWCSHSLEHLYHHEVEQALGGIFRILRPTGFVLVTAPDLLPIAALVVEGRLTEVAYDSPAGPITALDMIYGHRASIQRGNQYMAHKTGFTEDSLAQLFIKHGFTEVMIIKGRSFDLFGLALMPNAEKDRLRAECRQAGLDFYE